MKTSSWSFPNLPSPRQVASTLPISVLKIIVLANAFSSVSNFVCNVDVDYDVILNSSGPSSAPTKRRNTSSALPTDSPSRSSRTLPNQPGRSASAATSNTLQLRNNSDPHLASSIAGMSIQGVKKKTPTTTLPKFASGEWLLLELAFISLLFSSSLFSSFPFFSFSRRKPFIVEFLSKVQRSHVVAIGVGRPGEGQASFSSIAQSPAASSATKSRRDFARNFKSD